MPSLVQKTIFCTDVRDSTSAASEASQQESGSDRTDTGARMVPRSAGRVTYVSPEFQARFWAKVDFLRGPVHPTLGRCWPWTLSKNRNGYGQFNCGTKRIGGLKKAPRPAHRIAFALTTGFMPPSSVLIRHRCNFPPCCRPDHLLPGSHLDNARDMVEAGRSYSPAGERNVNSRLVEAQVVEIRERRAGGETTVALAAAYGMSTSLVSQICTGQRWRTAAGPVSTSARSSRAGICAPSEAHS